MGEDFYQPSWDALLINEGARNGWVVPRSSWWQRLPLIRHTRAILRPAGDTWRTGYDNWIFNMIWRGWC